MTLLVRFSLSSFLWSLGLLSLLKTGRNTFNSVQKWIDDARAIRGDDVIMLLVGNKIDAADKRQVSTSEGEKLGADLGITFIETSAKAGMNIK